MRGQYQIRLGVEENMKDSMPNETASDETITVFIVYKLLNILVVFF